MTRLTALPAPSKVLSMLSAFCSRDERGTAMPSLATTSATSRQHRTRRSQVSRNDSRVAHAEHQLCLRHPRSAPLAPFPRALVCAPTRRMEVRSSMQTDWENPRRLLIRGQTFLRRRSRCVSLGAYLSTFHVETVRDPKGFDRRFFCRSCH